MRLTKQEKERLFDLLDDVTDRCLKNEKEMNEKDTKIFWSIFLKLRMELKGF